MFGISFFEFIIIIIVIILAFRPADIPNLIKDIYRAVFKVKNFFYKMKAELRNFNKSLGIDEIEQELDKSHKEVKKIIDIYGNEHQVSGVNELRSDMKQEEIDQEITKENKKNSDNITSFMK